MKPHIKLVKYEAVIIIILFLLCSFVQKFASFEDKFPTGIEIIIFWFLIPYLVMIVIGILIYKLCTIKGICMIDTLLLAVLNMVMGIGLAVFAIFLLFGIIQPSAFFLSWDKYGKMPSLILAGCNFMEAYKNFTYYRTMKNSKEE